MWLFWIDASGMPTKGRGKVQRTTDVHTKIPWNTYKQEDKCMRECRISEQTLVRSIYNSQCYYVGMYCWGGGVQKSQGVIAESL